MELSRHASRASTVKAATALAAAVAVAAALAPGAGAAAAPRKLSAEVDKATFTTTYRLTTAGGKLGWRLDAAKLGSGTLTVRLVVPYNGNPVSLTLCTKCRSTEVGQAVVATPIAKVIAAGKATVEIERSKGKLLTAALKP
jgi:hypothetical protein